MLNDRDDQYNALVNADDIWIQTKWYTTDGDRGFPDVDNIDGLRVDLDEDDIQELVYGDAYIYDFIEDFEELVAGSVDSFEEYYEDLAERTGGDRGEWCALANVQLGICVEDEPVFYNTYWIVDPSEVGL